MRFSHIITCKTHTYVHTPSHTHTHAPTRTYEYMKACTYKYQRVHEHIHIYSDGCMAPLKGLCFAHFSTQSFHCICTMISIKNMEKTHTKCFPAVGFHGNGGHIRFYGTHHGTYNFKTASSHAVKSCTHIEDI